MRRLKPTRIRRPDPPARVAPPNTVDFAGTEAAFRVDALVRSAVVFACLMIVPACDSDLLTERTYAVEVLAIDRATAGSGPQTRRAAPLPPVAPRLQIGQQAYEGSLEVRARVALVHTSGAVAELSAAPAITTLSLGDDRSVTVGVNSIPAGRYTTAIITFEEVRAVLTAGPGIAGETLVEVDIGTEPLAVARLVNLVAGVTERETMLIEMNCAEWIGQHEKGVVAAGPFESAVGIRVL